MDRQQRAAELRMTLTSQRGKDELLALLKKHAGLEEGYLPSLDNLHVEIILSGEAVEHVPPQQAPKETEPGDVKFSDPPAMESPGG
jgi:hypothetical protein